MQEFETAGQTSRSAPLKNEFLGVTMASLVEFDVEVQRCDGSIAKTKMVWPSLTKGQRVNVRVNDRDWSLADVVDVVRRVSGPESGSYRAIVREVEAKPSA
jgi:hypothetical protein